MIYGKYGKSFFCLLPPSVCLLLSPDIFPVPRLVAIRPEAKAIGVEDKPLVDAVLERVLDRTLPAVGDDTFDDRREDGQIIRRRHQFTPRTRAASTPDRQPSSWKPQPW